MRPRPDVPPHRHLPARHDQRGSHQRRQAPATLASRSPPARTMPAPGLRPRQLVRAWQRPRSPRIKADTPAVRRGRPLLDGHRPRHADQVTLRADVNRTCRIECVSCTRFDQRVICKGRVWPAADGSCPAGAARHDPLPLARLPYRSSAGLALQRLVDAGELDGPDRAWPGASQCAETVPGLSPGGIYRRGWISQARMRRLRCGRVRPAVGGCGLRYGEAGREADWPGAAAGCHS